MRCFFICFHPHRSPFLWIPKLYLVFSLGDDLGSFGIMARTLGWNQVNLLSKTDFNNISTLDLEQVILPFWACIAFLKINKMQLLIHEMQNDNKCESTEVLTCNQIVSVSWIWFFKIAFNYFTSVCFPNLASGEQVLCFTSLSPHKSSGCCYVKICSQLINLE